MPGGQGTSWLAGHLVLKPGDGPAHGWLGNALADLVIEGIRVATPVASRDGAWVVEGWTATLFVPGAQPDLSLSSTLTRIVEAGQLFHQAVAGLPRPDFLDVRDDPWAVADRVAWREQRTRFVAPLANVARRLSSQPDPPGSPQLVHGDLTGNVLLAPNLAPAVIDLSPYWRPTSYAEAVVIADALCYHGATSAVLRDVGLPVEAVARALLFRLATTNAFAQNSSNETDLESEAQRYERAAFAIGL